VKRRSVIELLIAVAAAVAGVASWSAASRTVTASPILPGEPETSEVVYSAPLLVLALLLVTAAGVLTVVAVARLRR
jgi:hypothetical protein